MSFFDVLFFLNLKSDRSYELWPNVSFANQCIFRFRMSEENGVQQVKKKIVMLTNDLEKYREKATKCEKETKSLRDRAEKVSVGFSRGYVKCLL